jgi:hypothetical protein
MEGSYLEVQGQVDVTIEEFRQVLANFLCKGPADSKYFGISPYGLCLNSAIVMHVQPSTI